MNELPPGWAATTLGIVAFMVAGSTPKGVLTAPSGSVPFYKVGDMNASKGHIMADARVTVTEDTAVALSLRVCPPGTVIFPKVGGALHTNKKRILATSAAFDTNTMGAIPTSAVDARFLFYWLSGIKLSEYAYGSPVPQLSRTKLSDEVLWLPPRPEQERIVAVIEEQLSRLDVGIAALRRARQNLNRMRATLLQAAVTGRLVGQDLADGTGLDLLARIAKERQGARPPVATSAGLAVPNTWAVASLEAVTDPSRAICYGILKPKVREEGTVPYVEVKDLRARTLDVATLHRTSAELHKEFSRSVLSSGDVVQAIRGSYDRALVVPPEVAGANMSRDVARIAPLSGISPSFLAAYLVSPPALQYLRERARGVAVKGVNIADLRSMPVPVPPEAEQERIVDEIDRINSIVWEVESVLDSTVATATALRSSIFTAAFSGKLAPQDPTDEPASSLLQRIAEERASSNGHKPMRGQKSRVLREEVPE